MLLAVAAGNSEVNYDAASMTNMPDLRHGPALRKCELALLLLMPAYDLIQ